MKLTLEQAGYRAVLVRNPGHNGWLLTGFELKPDEKEVILNTFQPTHLTPTGTRREEGAGADTVGDAGAKANMPKRNGLLPREGSSGLFARPSGSIETGSTLPKAEQPLPALARLAALATSHPAITSAGVAPAGQP